MHIYSILEQAVNLSNTSISQDIASNLSIILPQHSTFQKRDENYAFKTKPSTFIYSKIISPVCQTFTHSRDIKLFALVGTCRKVQLVILCYVYYFFKAVEAVNTKINNWHSRVNRVSNVMDGVKNCAVLITKHQSLLIHFKRRDSRNKCKFLPSNDL